MILYETIVLVTKLKAYYLLLCAAEKTDDIVICCRPVAKDSSTSIRKINMEKDKNESAFTTGIGDLQSYGAFFRKLRVLIFYIYSRIIYMNRD